MIPYITYRISIDAFSHSWYWQCVYFFPSFGWLGTYQFYWLFHKIAFVYTDFSTVFTVFYFIDFCPYYFPSVINLSSVWSSSFLRKKLCTLIWDIFLISSMAVSAYISPNYCVSDIWQILVVSIWIFK